MAAVESFAQREKRELNLRLDEELEGTFPASDPPTITRFSAKSHRSDRQRKIVPAPRSERSPKQPVAARDTTSNHLDDLSPRRGRRDGDSRSNATAGVPQGLIEAILGSASDAIIATDEVGRITFWNPGAIRIFGFTSEEAIGSSLDLIIPETLRARHWAGYNRVMATGESRYGNGDLLSVPGLTKDGRRISVEFTIALLRDQRRKLIGTAAVLRDATQRFEEIRELRHQLRNL